jgi:colanic acid biosynthesis glycosyl transferase WcaI
MKPKRFLVIGYNCLPEQTGIGRYNGEMVEWLAEQGHQVTVVTGFPYYPQWRIQAPYTGRWYKKEQMHEGRLRLIRCPLYVPQKPTGKRRLLQDASFFFTAFWAVVGLIFTRQFDTILCVAPPFHIGALGRLYRWFRGGECWYHIQDLQIDMARDMGLLKSKPLIRGLFGAEKYLLRKADRVSTISPGMQARVHERTNAPVIMFPNWVDLQSFQPLANRSSLKSRWGIDPDKKWVLYSGAIGEKQGLESILRVAGRVHATNPEIHFSICGSGPYKQKLESLAGEMGLSNLSFLPLQPKESFNEFLNAADLHLVLQKGGAGDLVMPSKLVTILSVGGLALVTADKGTSLHNLISENRLGLVVPPEQDEALLKGILEGVSGENEAARKSARAYCEGQLEYHAIMNRFFYGQVSVSEKEGLISEEERISTGPMEHSVV